MMHFILYENLVADPCNRKITRAVFIDLTSLKLQRSLIFLLTTNLLSVKSFIYANDSAITVQAAIKKWHFTAKKLYCNKKILGWWKKTFILIWAKSDY